MLGKAKEKAPEATPPVKVTAEVTTLAPPATPSPKPPVTLIMNTDGGLNGLMWRAGHTVILDAEAADFYLAKGYATRAK